jgi:hypothetical protein
MEGLNGYLDFNFNIGGKGGGNMRKEETHDKRGGEWFFELL